MGLHSPLPRARSFLAATCSALAVQVMCAVFVALGCESQPPADSSADGAPNLNLEEEAIRELMNTAHVSEPRARRLLTDERLLVRAAEGEGLAEHPTVRLAAKRAAVGALISRIGVATASESSLPRESPSSQSEVTAKRQALSALLAEASERRGVTYNREVIERLILHRESP